MRKKKDSVNVSMRLDRETWDRLRNYAEERGSHILSLLNVYCRSSLIRIRIQMMQHGSHYFENLSIFLSHFMK